MRSAEAHHQWELRRWRAALARPASCVQPADRRRVRRLFREQVVNHVLGHHVDVRKVLQPRAVHLDGLLLGGHALQVVVAVAVVVRAQGHVAAGQCCRTACGVGAGGQGRAGNEP